MSGEEKKYGDPRSTEFRTKLNFILVICLNKINTAERIAQLFSSELKVTVESPGLSAVVRALSTVARRFSKVEWVCGRAFSSQLRLSKAKILSVLDLRNSKFWWTRNLVS